jgi:hypothetical protein
MKLFKIIGSLSALAALIILAPAASAATSPGLGAASTFVILSDTYSNTTPGTTLSGDVGYTTPPQEAPTINGATHSADSVYAQAGIDQNSALVNLNNQPCSFTFAPGDIDLASDTTHGPVGVYQPGVYCIDGAAEIGGGGTVTLNGAGTYIFRMEGALTSSANSNVVLANGASVCTVWWTPTEGTTLGENSLFAGIDIDAAGITAGDSVTWEGRALAFGGTVTTDNDTISAPTCTETTPNDGSTGGETGTGGTAGNGSTTPGIPNTGIAPSDSTAILSILAIVGLGAIITAVVVVRKNAALKR